MHSQNNDSQAAPRNDQWNDARAKFNALIKSGASRAEQVFNRIADDVPQDRIAKAKALRFSFGTAPQPQLASVHALKPDAKPFLDELPGDALVASILDDSPAPPRSDEAPSTPPVSAGPSRLLLDVADQTQAVHAHALGQLAERFRLCGVKVPIRYLRALVDSGDEDARAIALEILNRTAGHANVRDQRLLVRGVRDEARAVMSDRYRRIDCRPILDTLVEYLQASGMVPIGGFASDTRVQLKFAMPKLIELRPGESPLLFGGAWQNSDFGHGSNGLALTITRMWCTNGCTSQSTMRQVHHGRTLPDDIQLAADTLAADTRANQLVMRDALASLLSPEKIQGIVDGLREADGQAVTWKEYEPRLKRLLGKTELAAVEKAFTGDDVINLPSGATRWRMSNAVSWIANACDSANRSLELERLAGSIAFGEKRLDADDAVIAA
jgi:hypothetical protein